MKKLMALMFALALTVSMSSFAFAQDTMSGDKKTDKKAEKKDKKAKKDKKDKKDEKKDDMKKDK